jgi:charged multivesicular body protein 7
MPTLLDWLVENEPSFRRTRLPSLYSDLSVQRTTNPEGYAANVTAWTSALTRASLAGQLPLQQRQRLILQTSDDLLNALASPQYGRPSGLGCVLDDAVRTGKMVDLHDFVASEKSIYSKSWIPSPWSILHWSLRKAGLVWASGSYDVNGHLRHGSSLVLVSALEEMYNRYATKLQKDHSTTSLTDRIMSREQFVTEVGELMQGLGTGTRTTTIAEQDVKVLLRYLSRDKQALSYDDTTIKLKAAGAAMPDPITQEDRSIASLKTLIANLSSQISSLTTKIATLQATAQTSVKAGNKASALSALRSKKLAERTLESRSNTLHQLEEVYTKIETAVDQVQVVAAMEASAGVLKTLNKKVGGADKVEDVIETLREEMAQVDEVSGVIAEPLDGKVVLDEADVDDELESMEQEERVKREKAEQAEKERQQAREAEVTRRRLAELEQLQLQQQAAKEKEKEKAEKEKEKEKQAEEDPTEQELSRSIERLERMEINGQELQAQ